MRRAYQTTLCCWLLLCLIPLLQRNLHFLPERGLTNTVRPLPPKASWEGVSSGKFQEKANIWFMRTSGLFGALVTTENQINYSLFRQVSSSYESAVVMAKGHYLIQRVYINELAGRRPVKLPDLFSAVEKLGRLKGYLEARGKALVVFASTNTASLYPELLGPEFRAPSSPPKNVDLLRPMLAQRQIPFVEAAAILREQSDKSPYPFFTASGSHWNSVANCLVTQKLVEKMSEALKRRVPNFACGSSVKVLDKPKPEDRDVVKMINLWNADPSLQPAPYINAVSLETPAEAFRPKVLFVGTSFLWAVTQLLEQMRVYESRDLYFYFNTNYFFNSEERGSERRGKRPIRREQIDWERDVFSKDVIVLEINDLLIDQLGFGFLDLALKAAGT